MEYHEHRWLPSTPRVCIACGGSPRSEEVAAGLRGRGFVDRIHVPRGVVHGPVGVDSINSSLNATEARWNWYTPSPLDLEIYLNRPVSGLLLGWGPPINPPCEYGAQVARGLLSSQVQREIKRSGYWARGISKDVRKWRRVSSGGDGKGCALNFCRPSAQSLPGNPTLCAAACWSKNTSAEPLFVARGRMHGQ